MNILGVKLAERDLINALIVGEMAAVFLMISFYSFLEGNVALVWYFFPVIFPALSVAYTWIFFSWGRRYISAFHAGKFTQVGVLNGAMDFGILNLLIMITGVGGGILYSLFKFISVSTSLANSYFWNKNWTFDHIEAEDERKEFAAFLVVSVIGLVVNVIVFTIMVYALPFFFTNAKSVIIANWSAGFAAVFANAWNFMGYRHFVFVKR